MCLRCDRKIICSSRCRVDQNIGHKSTDKSFHLIIYKKCLQLHKSNTKHCKLTVIIDHKFNKIQKMALSWKLIGLLLRTLILKLLSIAKYSILLLETSPLSPCHDVLKPTMEICAIQFARVVWLYLFSLFSSLYSVTKNNIYPRWDWLGTIIHLVYDSL